MSHEPRFLVYVEGNLLIPLSDRVSLEMQDFMSQVENGLFRMRYVFALIIGLKVFKIFFAASVG